jgi:hypothetical protein
MRIGLAIIFWTLAALETAALLFMLFFSLAAGPGMAENGDMATPLLWNVLLPLVVLAGAMILFVRARSMPVRLLCLVVVLVPVFWILKPPAGETICTKFENGVAVSRTRC